MNLTSILQRLRRPDAVTVLAVSLPLLVLGSLLPIRTIAPTVTLYPPVVAPLSHVSIVCPTPVARPAGDIRLTRGPDVPGGQVAVRVAEDGRTVGIARPSVGDGVRTVRGSRRATVITGRGDAASGLVAGRSEPGAGAECREPWHDEWFVGLGAGARESSVIELVNPDPSTAVVNVEVHGPEGLLDGSSWYGVTVPGHAVEQVVLGERPVRGAVAAHVTVQRGRVAAGARHTWDPLGAGTATTDYVPAQPRPATDNLLLGVPATGQRRFLHVANPGNDEARVRVQLVTADATFTPGNSPTLTVPPRSHLEVPLADHLDGAVRSQVLGLRLESSVPVAAGVRAIVDGDLRIVAPVDSFGEPMVALLPGGSQRLVIGGADGTGTVRIAATTANGRVLWDDRSFEVAAGHAVTVDLPSRAARVVLTPRRTAVAATLVTRSPDGVGTMRLRPWRTHADVPDVRPGH